MLDTFKLSTITTNTECGITLLETIGYDRRTGEPNLAGKTFTATDEGWSKKSYGAGYKFRVTECSVANLADLHDVIKAVSPNSHFFAIRGAPNALGRRLLAAHKGQPIRRLLLPQSDGTQPNFEDVPRRWVMFDLDKYPLGDADLSTDPEAAIEAAIRNLLPETFWNVDYIWQLSSSAGFDPVLKVHLWFWLSQPIDGVRLKAIMLGVAPAFDPRLCSPVQNHYLSAPQVIGGCDPIQKRLGWHQGDVRALDVPTLVALIPPPSERTRRPAKGISSGTSGVLLEEMGDGDGLRGFHAPLLAETVRYARQCRNTGARNDARWIEMIQATIRDAPHAPSRDTTHYEASDYLETLIESAFDRVLADDTEANAVHDDSNPGRLVRQPSGFTRGDHGLFFKGADDDKPERVSAGFNVIGHIDDGTGKATGLLLEWHDQLRRKHHAIVPRDLLHGQPSDLAAPLESQGLRCLPWRVHLLRMYLHLIEVPNTLTAVSRPGWVNDAYVMRDGSVIGDPRVVMRPEAAVTDASTGQGGTLADWKREIAKYAVGNPALGAAICIQFAAPLLALTGDEGGGLHYYGKSRGGKTTALCVCASVIGKGSKKGGAVLSWRGTDNGMEAAAANANDGVLPLDEISEVNGQVVGTIIYMLANGSGKARMTAKVTQRETKRWNCFILSNGEMTIVAKMGEAGKKVAAGMAVRMTDVPFIETTNHHEFASGEALSEHLKQASKTTYGTAGRVYLARHAEARRLDEDGLLDRIRVLRAAWMDIYCPREADPQVRSIAQRFSLIGVAGELAREWNVLPWEDTEAMVMAGSLFDRTIAARGHTGSAEGQAAVDVVGAFIAKHGSSRFSSSLDDCDPSGEVTRDRMGFRQYSKADGCYVYYIFPQLWPEVCGTLDPQEAARELADRKFLLRDGKNLTCKKQFAGQKRQRYYAILGAVTGKDEDGEN